jgi:hypothetical protein
MNVFRKLTRRRQSCPLVKKILFPHGKTVITPAALEVLQELDIIQLLGWHLTGDWSQMSEADRAANAQALENGSRIFSSYEVKGQNIWVSLMLWVRMDRG